MSDGKVLADWLVSGLRGPAYLVESRTPGWDAYMRQHAEGHAVACMQANGVKKADLYLNNAPCRACVRGLPRVLRADEALTLHLPDGRIETFKGRS